MPFIIKNVHVLATVITGSILTLGTITLAQSPNSESNDGTGQPGTSASTRPSASTTPSASASPQSIGGTQRTVYEVTLAPINSSVTPPASGTVRFVVDSDNIGVFVQASGLAPNVAHPMHIHAGSTCATQAADTNGDGIVDDVESEAVSGPPVVGLDLNANQAATSSSVIANAIYPMAGTNGNLTYINSFPLSSVIAALNIPNPVTSVNPSASPSSIASPSASASPAISASATPVALTSPSASSSPSGTPNAPGVSGVVNLENHVVEIHGVATDAQLPNTVQSNDNLPATTTLPVACGIITQVRE